MDKGLPSVVLVDEYPLFRMAMADVLTRDSRFRVVGEADSKESAIALLSLDPDLYVISLDAESYDALNLLQEIKAHRKDIRVIMILSSPEQSGLLMRAIRLRANGYLLRTISPAEFIEQMDMAARGGMAASEQVTSALAARLRGGQVTTVDERYFHFLTDREQDVLCCVASGLTNAEAGEELGIAPATVKVHVKHLLKKLNFNTRVEMAVWAAECGFRLQGRMPKPSGQEF